MPASVCIKFILHNQKWRKLPLRISSKTSFFSWQCKLSALVDMALHFPQRHQSRFPFHYFSASIVCMTDFFVCILTWRTFISDEELASPSVFSLSLTVGSKLYGFSLLKLEKLSSESELKEASLDNKLE